MSNLSEEEKKAIEDTKNILKEWQKIVDIKDPVERDIEMSLYIEEMPFYTMKTLLNLIDRLQKELDSKNKLILDLKEKLNNIQFEVETAWRKIEKMENNNE